MMCDTGVSSAWQENGASGGRETAYQGRNCPPYPPITLPSQVHARVTDDEAGRQGRTYVPRVVITDTLASDGAARREVLPSVEHRRHQGRNNRAEHAHQPTRERARRMRRFKDPGHAQRFLAASGPIASHCRPRRHRLTAPAYRATRAGRFATWRTVTGTPAMA